MFSLFDIYATPISLSFKKKKSFSTSFSLILSIIVIILYLISISYFSQVLFQKINPGVTTFTTYPNEIKFNTTFNSANFSLQFFFDEPTENIEQYFEITSYLFDNNSGIFEKIKIKDCAEIFSDIIMERTNIFCLDNGGEYFDMGSKFLSVNINRCKNTTENYSICKSNEEIDMLIETNSIGIFVFTLDENLNDYEDPYKQIFSYLVNPLDNKYYTDFRIEYKLNELITDDGLIFETLKTNTSLIVHNTMIDVIRSKEEYSLASISIYLDPAKKTVKRTYKKLQDVLSNIGGLMPIFNLIGQLLVTISNHVMMNISFANKLFNFEDFKSRNKKYEILSDNLNKNIPIYGIRVANKTKKVNDIIDPRDFIKHSKYNQKKSDGSHVKINKIDNLEKEFLNFEKIKKRKQKVNISFFEILFVTICLRKCMPESYKLKKLILGKLEKFYYEQTDISSFIKNSREINLMKSLILTEKERLLMRYVSKPHFDDLLINKEEMNENSFIKFVDYYKEIVNKDRSEVEEKLYEMIDKNFKEFFENYNIENNNISSNRNKIKTIN
jgi:hypothetical protein